MADWPDEDELLPGTGGGEPISQDALDALLASSSSEIDDSGAFGGFGDAEESDLDFGMGADGGEEDAMGGLGEDTFASTAAAMPAIDTEPSAGMGAVDFSAFQMAGGG